MSGANISAEAHTGPAAVAINAGPHIGPSATAVITPFIVDEHGSFLFKDKLTAQNWGIFPVQQWLAINSAYSLLKLKSEQDVTGDKLLDRVANLVHQNKHAHTGHELSEKNKALASQNAELTDKLNKAYGAVRVLQETLMQVDTATDHPLFKIFKQAIDQAQNGKGEERHGQGKPFMQQPWRRLGDVYGSEYFFAKADHKLETATRLVAKELRLTLRLQALNHIAMGLLHEDLTNNPAEAE